MWSSGTLTAASSDSSLEGLHELLLGDPGGPEEPDYTCALAHAGGQPRWLGAIGEKNRRGRRPARLAVVNSPDPDSSLPNLNDPDEALAAALHAGPEETYRIVCCSLGSSVVR